MKKISKIILSLLLLFGVGNMPLFAEANSSGLTEQLVESGGANTTIYVTNAEMLEMMKESGMDPKDYFSKSDLNTMRMQDIRRAGANKIVVVSRTYNYLTQDVYLSSYWAGIAKAAGAVGIGFLLPGMAGPVSIGAAAIDTSRGIIVRVKTRVRDGEGTRDYSYVSVRRQ